MVKRCAGFVPPAVPPRGLLRLVPSGTVGTFFIVHDEEKPRRSKADEIAEIRDREAEVQAAAEPRRVPPAIAPDLPLAEIVSRMEANEEAAFQARERAETPEEAEESARILGVERNIAADIPICLGRELQRTFGRAGGRAYAAAAAD